MKYISVSLCTRCTLMEEVDIGRRRVSVWQLKNGV